MATLVSDSFNRADGALGTADSGQTWAYVNTTAAKFAVSNNRAVGGVNFTANQYAYVDAGIVPSVIQAKVIYKAALRGCYEGVVFRGVNDGNHWSLNLVPLADGTGVFVLAVWYANYPTWNDVDLTDLVEGQWYTIKVVDYGTYMETYLDDELIHTKVDSAHNSGTRVGIAITGGSNSGLDDFLVTGGSAAPSARCGLSGLSGLSGIFA